jgi:hypothetical protein
MQVSPAELKKSLTHVLRAGLVGMVSGSPGLGKSDIAGRDIADTYNLEMIDIRLSQRDQTDLLGFPKTTGQRMGYCPPEDLPLQEMDTVPDGKNGWLLFLDEFSSASMAVQAAAYKLVLDRQVGKYNLHKKVHIVCAGNNKSDGAIVNRLGTAMQSRLVHLELIVNATDWLIWAAQNQLDYRITSYIEHRPNILHKFDPNHNDHTFSCPRTWHFASKLIKNQLDLKDMLPVIAGTVSEGVAREFIAYTELCTRLPSIKDIISNPTSTSIDSEPSMLYAVSHMVAAYMDPVNVDPIMQYVKRLPIEYGTVATRSALKRQPALAKTQAVKDFRNLIAQEIF